MFPTNLLSDTGKNDCSLVHYTQTVQRKMILSCRRFKFFFPAVIWKKKKKSDFWKGRKNKYLVMGPAPVGSCCGPPCPTVATEKLGRCNGKISKRLPPET